MGQRPSTAVADHICCEVPYPTCGLQEIQDEWTCSVLDITGRVGGTSTKCRQHALFRTVPTTPAGSGSARSTDHLLLKQKM